jgi:hypothetical protein
MAQRLSCLWLTGICIFSASGWAESPVEGKRLELELQESTFGERAYELSGIARWRNAMLIVADNNDDLAISEIRTHRNRFLIEPRLELANLRGFDAFKLDALNQAKARGHDRWLDLEGIATCGDVIYLANERIRQVVRVENQMVTGLAIDFSGFPQIMDGESNAGFEGIAVDCANQIMWLAKERDPRGIVAVDLKQSKATGFHLVPGSDRQGQRVMEWRSGNGLIDVSPDIGDLFFSDGHLYVLERNSYEIAKLDVQSYAVVARVSFFQSAFGMYDTGEPFGVAEALWMDSDTIWLGMDNNGSQLATRATERFRVSGNPPGILKLRRPSKPKF